MKAGITICLEKEELATQQQSHVFPARMTSGEQAIIESTFIPVVQREFIEKALRDEKDSNTRRRMLLVLKVKYYGVRQNQAARELGSMSSWAAKWVKRFEERGIDGLRSKKKAPERLKNDPRERTCTVARSEDEMRSSLSPVFSSPPSTVSEATPDIYGKQLNYSTTLKRLESAENILAENRELLKKFFGSGSKRKRKD